MEVLDLGLMEYGACLERVQRLHADRVAGRVHDTLIVVEHPPVATLGRRGTPAEVFDPDLPVFAIERGGKATYHAPGQLVLYPIMHLGTGNRDVRAFVRHLEAFVIHLLDDFGIPAVTRPETPGVWTVKTGKKIASIGIAIRDWVTLHGIALNVTLDPKEFERIDPCGLGAAVMTNMQLEGADIKMSAARKWVHEKAASELAKFTPNAYHA